MPCAWVSPAAGKGTSRVVKVPPSYRYPWKRLSTSLIRMYEPTICPLSLIPCAWVFPLSSGKKLIAVKVYEGFAGILGVLLGVLLISTETLTFDDPGTVPASL